MPTTQDRVQKINARFYKIDDREYPSVTTILQVIAKPALVNWAAKVEREMVTECSADLYQDTTGTPSMSRTAWITSMQSRLTKAKAHQKELEKAATIGAQVHSLIEWTLKAEFVTAPGPCPRISDKAQWAFMAWEDWRKSVNLKPIAVEQVVYSNEYCYAGTLDLLAEVNGKLSVVDWKTGKAIYSEAHLQNASYRQAVREMGHGDPQQGIIVRLPKVETDPQFEAIEASEEAKCFSTFLHALELWKYQRAIEEESEWFKEQAKKEKKNGDS